MVISINLDKHAVCHSQLIIPVELFLVAATKSARELFALLQVLANFKQCQANEKEKKKCFIVSQVNERQVFKVSDIFIYKDRTVGALKVITKAIQQP